MILIFTGNEPFREQNRGFAMTHLEGAFNRMVRAISDNGLQNDIKVIFAGTIDYTVPYAYPRTPKKTFSHGHNFRDGAKTTIWLKTPKRYHILASVIVIVIVSVHNIQSYSLKIFPSKNAYVLKKRFCHECHRFRIVVFISGHHSVQCSGAD